MLDLRRYRIFTENVSVMILSNIFDGNFYTINTYEIYMAMTPFLEVFCTKLCLPKLFFIRRASYHVKV